MMLKPREKLASTVQVTALKRLLKSQNQSTFFQIEEHVHFVYI